MSTLRTFNFLVVLWAALNCVPTYAQHSAKKPTQAKKSTKSKVDLTNQDKIELPELLPTKASPSTPEAPPLPALSPESVETTTVPAPKVKKGLGLDLNTFFYGPGIAPGSRGDVNPGYDGRPMDTGIFFYNLASLKWRFSERLAFDVQFRSQITITNLEGVKGNHVKIFSLNGPQIGTLEHQGQRFGISGKLFKGENWSISGAVNTDIPLEIGGTKLQGQMNSERKLLFNPGMWAFWSYTPPDTRWSGFALLSPRFYIYSDRFAVSRQDADKDALAWKPDYILIMNPSVNYAVNSRVGIRFGTTLDYSKMVKWDSIRRNYMPFELGVTYDVTPTISIYPYILGSSPIDDSLRKEQGAGNIDWRRTWSFNIWLSGSLF